MSASYRLYILDPRDRTIMEAVEIGHRDSDGDALSEATPFFKLLPAELWDRARRVYRYEPSVPLD